VIGANLVQMMFLFSGPAFHPRLCGFSNMKQFVLHVDAYYQKFGTRKCPVRRICIAKKVPAQRDRVDIEQGRRY
jgi:hypothetical protein